MLLLSKTITDLQADAAALRRARYGVIHTSCSQLLSVRLRPLPKLISSAEVALLGRLQRATLSTDSCWLYYDQPRSCSNFLALKYIVSGTQTQLATIRAALTTLDTIAALKQTDAILCDVSNRRISARLLKREGWEPHTASRWHRNYIRRFYGHYPTANHNRAAVVHFA